MFARTTGSIERRFASGVTRDFNRPLPLLDPDDHGLPRRPVPALAGPFAADVRSRPPRLRRTGSIKIFLSFGARNSIPSHPFFSQYS